MIKRIFVLMLLGLFINGCVFIEAEGIKYSRYFGGQEITGFKMKKTAKTLEVEFSKQKGTESKLVEAVNELIKRLPVVP